MRKFRFRLQTLKRHREMIEREKQGKLSLVMTSLKEAKAELDGIDEIRNKHYSSIHYWLIDKYLRGLKIRREEIKTRLKEKEQEAEDAYKEFMNARQEVKKLSVLHDKQFEMHKEKERKRENKLLSDIYIMRDRLNLKSEEK